MTMFPINELFETIQGEATWVGTPSTFVRFQGCPVGCAFCDTKHTWEIDDQHQTDRRDMLAKTESSPAWAQMHEDALIEEIVHRGPRHVVLTGGEPALYNLNRLTRLLRDMGLTVQIETSGTHDIRVDLATWVTVAPKIDQAGGFAVLPNAIYRANEIKMPVGKQSDIDAFAALIAGVGPHPGVPIWLAPISQSEKATSLCVREAMRRNWRVSMQVHLLADWR